MADETACPPRTTLIHGDCLEVMPTLPPQSVQMAFADLPYGVTNNAWDKSIDLPKLWKQLDALCYASAAKCFTAQQPFTTSLINSNAARFRYDLVWCKNRYAGIANAKRAPLRAHETVLVFDAQHAYQPQKTFIEKTRTIIRCGSDPKANKNTGIIGKTHTLTNWRYPTSILRINRDDKRDGSGHPTQKPIALLEWLIKTYTHPSDTVFDPVAGSGTTAVAALRTGRHAICIEKDAAYFDVMRKRVDAERAALGLLSADFR